MLCKCPKSVLFLVVVVVVKDPKVGRASDSFRRHNVSIVQQYVKKEEIRQQHEV